MKSEADILEVTVIEVFREEKSVNNNNICLKSNIQTSSVDYQPRELTHACSIIDMFVLVHSLFLTDFLFYGRNTEVNSLHHFKYWI